MSLISIYQNLFKHHSIHLFDLFSYDCYIFSPKVFTKQNIYPFWVFDRHQQKCHTHICHIFVYRCFSEQILKLDSINILFVIYPLTIVMWLVAIMSAYAFDRFLNGITCRIQETLLTN